eukprot:4310-Heterococcus_DN1.PRE.3
MFAARALVRRRAVGAAVEALCPAARRVGPAASAGCIRSINAQAGVCSGSRQQLECVNAAFKSSCERNIFACAQLCLALFVKHENIDTLGFARLS